MPRVLSAIAIVGILLSPAMAQAPAGQAPFGPDPNYIPHFYPGSVPGKATPPTSDDTNKIFGGPTIPQTWANQPPLPGNRGNVQ